LTNDSFTETNNSQRQHEELVARLKPRGDFSNKIADENITMATIIILGVK
jgi:hypothetical protein